MQIAYQTFIVLSVVLFLSYGMSVLVSDAMVTEFERFGLVRFRKLTGSLEVGGALGLLAGYVVPTLVVAASGGLTLLMAFGVVARIRVRDPAIDMVPALVLMLMNLYICMYAIGWRGSV